MDDNYPEDSSYGETTQTPREKLHCDILADLRSRSSWERRQVEFYKMRHNGLARQNKPFKTASDLHWPLIDTNIEKLKPLFFQQIVGMDVVATMVPMKGQYAGMTTAAEQWFDYKIREKTNLQDEALAWIDYALMAGRGVVKVTWNDVKARIQFDAIDPLYLIIPSWTKELQDADRIVHVMPMSEGAYKRSGKYKCDKETLCKIKGNADSPEASGSDEKMQAARVREGITHDSNCEKIIVWEVYSRGADGSWEVRTFSPSCPEINLREPMALPYEHGMAPFVDFAYEVKDKGWYSPRGIAEILAPFESALCHTWNQKHDAMTYFNRPTYKAEREVPNTLNLRMAPGQILPYGIAPNPPQQMPQSFDEELVQVRSIAEQRVSNPDYGMGQVIDTKNRRTATEISAINGQSQQAGDLRARIFRMALAKAYKMAWSMYVQYDSQDLQYRFQEDSMQVDAQALHDQYHIEPKGGVNEINRQFLIQKGVARLQMLKGSPYWDQAELERSVVELDDPTLIKRAFKDPNTKTTDESTEEAMGIPTLLLGYPIPVEQGWNYPVRVGVIMAYIQSAIKQGQQIPPVGQKALVGRLQGLIQADSAVDNNGAKALGKSVEEFLRSIGFIPPEVPPMQGPAVQTAQAVAAAPNGGVSPITGVPQSAQQ